MALTSAVSPDSLAPSGYSYSYSYGNVLVYTKTNSYYGKTSYSYAYDGWSYSYTNSYGTA